MGDEELFTCPECGASVFEQRHLIRLTVRQLEATGPGMVPEHQDHRLTLVCVDCGSKIRA